MKLLTKIKIFALTMIWAPIGPVMTLTIYGRIQYPHGAYKLLEGSAKTDWLNQSIAYWEEVTRVDELLMLLTIGGAVVYFAARYIEWKRAQV